MVFKVYTQFVLNKIKLQTKHSTFVFSALRVRYPILSWTQTGYTVINVVFTPLLFWTWFVVSATQYRKLVFIVLAKGTTDFHGELSSLPTIKQLKRNTSVSWLAVSNLEKVALDPTFTSK